MVVSRGSIRSSVVSMMSPEGTFVLFATEGPKVRQLGRCRDGGYGSCCGRVLQVDAYKYHARRKNVRVESCGGAAAVLDGWHTLERTRLKFPIPKTRGGCCVRQKIPAARLHGSRRRKAAWAGP